ncbi:MAG: LytR/AlgR family response regulator transcription factor [Cellulosilyticaceae bacterium]
MYNIAICEDEQIQLQTTARIFLDIQEKEGIKFNVDLFTSGEALIANGYEQYDIIILDIQMKEMDGVETAKTIRKTNKKVDIIFVTGMEKYWPEGYNVNAYRYILKPINTEAFYKLMMELINEKVKNEAFITLKNEGALEKVLVSDIKYLAISQRKVKIYTNSGIYVSNISLSEWSEKLAQYGFANPHTSYLVNFKYVKSIDKEKVVITNGDIVYVSQRKYKEFKNRFIEYIRVFR